MYTDSQRDLMGVKRWRDLVNYLFASSNMVYVTKTLFGLFLLKSIICQHTHIYTHKQFDNKTRLDILNDVT